MARASGDGRGNEFDLGEFVGEVSELFVVMGVFGALVFYISQTADGPVSEASFMIKTGFVTAFLLSLLVLFLIYSKMREAFGSWPALYRAHLRAENLDLLAFSLLLFLLVLSVGRVLMLRQPMVFLLVAAATMGGVVLVSIRTADLLARRAPGPPPVRVGLLFVSFGGLLAGSAYLRSGPLGGEALSPVAGASVSNPGPFVENLLLLAVVTAQSVAAVGVIGTAISVPIAALGWLGVVGGFEG